MKIILSFTLFSLIVTPLWALAADAPAPDFHKQVAPIFTKYCTGCHNASDFEGKLSLENYDALVKGGKRGQEVLAGNGDRSRLYRVLTGGEPSMPPKDYDRPKKEEIALIKSWIDAGAKGPTGAAIDPTVLITPKIAPTAPVRRAINAVAWSPDGKLLAVARYGAVELRSADSQALLRTLTGLRGNANDVVFSRDGDFVAAGGGEAGLFGEAKIWKTADGSLSQSFLGHKDAIYAIALTPDDKLLATGSYDQQIKLWNVADGKVAKTLSGHNGAIFGLSFGPEGKLLASASGDRTIKLWDVASGERLDTFGQPTGDQYTVAFRPDGKQIVAGGTDNRIRVWNVGPGGKEGTNDLVTSRFAHEGAIVRLAYSRDGQLLASAAEDRTVKVWDANTIVERLSLERQPDLAPGLAISPDGKLAVVGRADGSLAFYDAASGAVKPVETPKPQLTAIEPRGIRIGESGKFKITATGLEAIKAWKVSNPGLTIKPGAGAESSPTEFVLDWSAAANLPRGACELWVETASGDSNKLQVFADDLPQQMEVEPNDTAAQANVAKLPVDLWGVLSQPGDVDYFAFDAQPGKTVVLDLQGEGVGGRGNLTLTLMDEQGKTIAYTGSQTQQPDPLLAFSPPRAGRYTARVGQLLSFGGARQFYRLSIGAFPFVSGIFPLSVAANASSEIELTGYNLPANSKVKITARAAGKVDVPLDAARFRWRRNLSVVVGELPEFVEVEPNDTPATATRIKVPCTASGRIWPTRPDQKTDVDLYRFEAKQGQVWIIETDAARRGSPIDTRIEVLHSDGKPVERVVLQAVRDSYLNFREIDSETNEIRLKNSDEMELNNYVYMGGEVCKLFSMPNGPDSDMLFYHRKAKRYSFFDTSSTSHALLDMAYIVEPHPPGEKLKSNGLPAFPVYYANDDASLRDLGTDSRVTFTAPADGEYLVRVSDTRGQGGDRYAYRLTIREPKPDFNVKLTEINGPPGKIAAGSGREFRFEATRIDGFDDEIRIDIGGTLPPGFQVTTPLLIEAGHDRADGVITATVGSPAPAKDNRMLGKIIATAMIDGRTIAKPLPDIGPLSLEAKPKLAVALLPDPSSGAGSHGGGPLEIVIVPGKTVSAILKVQRNGFDGIVKLDVNNLPHGVIVDNLGLNKILIPAGESQRQIFLKCAKWVSELDRQIYTATDVVGGQASNPVWLRVRKPAAVAGAR